MLYCTCFFPLTSRSEVLPRLSPVTLVVTQWKRPIWPCYSPPEDIVMNLLTTALYICLFMRTNNNLVCLKLKYPKIKRSHVLYFVLFLPVFLHSACSPADQKWDTCIFYRTIIVLSEIVALAALWDATLYSYWTCW